MRFCGYITDMAYCSTVQSGSHRNELPGVQVGWNDIVRRLYDSNTVEPGGNIGLMIIHCEDTVECQHNFLSLTCELPVEDSPVRFDMH